MTPADGVARPAPRPAFERWMESLTRAGWSVPGTGPGAGGGPGDAAVELVPVGEALGRVTAAPVLARWSSPRLACAAMDGIAVRAADLAAAPAVDRAADGTAGVTGDETGDET